MVKILTCIVSVLLLSPLQGLTIYNTTSQKMHLSNFVFTSSQNNDSQPVLICSEQSFFVSIDPDEKKILTNNGSVVLDSCSDLINKQIATLKSSLRVLYPKKWAITSFIIYGLQAAYKVTIADKKFQHNFDDSFIVVIYQKDTGEIGAEKYQDEDIKNF